MNSFKEYVSLQGWKDVIRKCQIKYNYSGISNETLFYYTAELKILFSSYKIISMFQNPTEIFKIYSLKKIDLISCKFFYFELKHDNTF